MDYVRLYTDLISIRNRAIAALAFNENWDAIREIVAECNHFMAEIEPKVFG